MNNSTRYKQIKKVTFIGAAINSILAVLKIWFGMLGHSHALVADGIHSFSDLLTDVLVILAARYGSQDADEKHPYGHRRIETVATVALAIFLIFVGLGIVYDSGLKLFSSKTTEEISAYVLIIATLSVIANEGLFRYTLRIAIKIRSNLLKANAWHSRTDAASSFIVLIGVAGSLLGFLYFDSIAAVIVGMMIARMGWNLGWTSIQELVDTSLDEIIVQKIKATILSVPGVLSVHQLRTRSMGGNVLVDVHVLVSPRLSVSEGHYISEQVYAFLAKEHERITDVIVHIDPEDDEKNPKSLNLPSREQLLKILKPRWKDLVEEFDYKNCVFHYLAGVVHIELHMSLKLLDGQIDAEILSKRFQDAVSDVEYIKTVKLLFV